MKINSLNAISPIDGRYRKKTESLSKYFSEESRLGLGMIFHITPSNIPTNFAYPLIFLIEPASSVTDTVSVVIKYESKFNVI